MDCRRRDHLREAQQRAHFLPVLLPLRGREQDQGAQPVLLRRHLHACEMGKSFLEGLPFFSPLIVALSRVRVQSTPQPVTVRVKSPRLYHEGLLQWPL